MRKSVFWKRFCLTVGLTLAAGAHAGFTDVEFSAEMRQSGPQGSTTGMMYVGKDRMRMEMEQGGQQIIQIIDAKNQVQWLLYPDQHAYMENRGGGSQPSGMEKSLASNPCAGVRGVTCKNLGKETIAGREAAKWEMTYTQEGKTYSSTQWIDLERDTPLRTRMADGSGSELKILGTETLNGRTVEKWEMVYTSPDQAAERSYQWYDPKLKITVREEFPGGHVRELVNIREGQLPNHLFKIPAGYKRISTPTPSQNPYQGR